MNPSTVLAATVVDELVRCGVRDAVLAPGSRNAPLSYALHAADAAGRLRLHVRIDERSAGFLALGLARVSHRPVPVCCTSGTAAANLHPAVLEASESGVPLLVLTADRPPELRDVGANQTVDQVKLYGGAVRWFAELGPAGEPAAAYWRSTVDRAVAAASGALSGDPGPVHLDLPLRDPLVPDGSATGPAEGRPGGAPWTSTRPAAITAPPVDPSVRRTLVVVGDAPADLGRRARELAEAAGWPLLAEPSSGARSGPHALVAPPLLLAVPGLLDALAPERVLVVGRPTLSRPVQALLRRPGVVVEVRAASPRWADAGRHAARVAVGLPERRTAGAVGDADDAGDREWLARWQAVSAGAAAALDAALDGGPLDGPRLARDLVRTLPAGALLVAGSSLPVRDLDVVPGDLGAVRVVANRGAAGIDGTVSTAVGAALAHGGPAYALLGDLTFLHDATGLMLGPAEPRPDLCLVVADNGGGGIFGVLEPGRGDPAALDRVFRTPVAVDLAALCAASGTPYTRVEAADALPAALAGHGLRVVHVPVPPPTRPDRLAAAVTAAVTPLLG